MVDLPDTRCQTLLPDVNVSTPQGVRNPLDRAAPEASAGHFEDKSISHPPPGDFNFHEIFECQFLKISTDPLANCLAQVCRVSEPPSSPWSGPSAPRSRSSVVRSYSTGQQEPRPYSPPLPNNTMLSLHQDNSRPLIQDSLEEDNNLEEDNIRESLPQDRMDIEVSPPSPSPPSSR